MCEVYDENVRLNIIRAGTEMQVAFCELKNGDMITENNNGPQCVVDFACESEDVHYEGWVMYDSNGNSHFPEDYGGQLLQSDNMTVGRCLELLNACIDRLTVGENTDGQLEILFSLGFTKDELVTFFNYSSCDIDDYLEENNRVEFECKLCGDVIEDDDESLWGHIQLHHEEEYAECQTWETPDMVDIYYTKIEREE